MQWFNVCIVVFMLNVASSFGEENLLQNSEFEDDIDGNWGCSNEETCLVERIKQPFIGEYSAHVHNRASGSEGCRQEVPNIKANTAYKVSAFIKILNPSLEQHIVRIIIIQRRGITNDRDQVAIILDVRASDGWIEMVGDFITKPDCESVAVMFIVAQHEEVEYLVDSASLVEIEQDPLWREKADERIEQHRKGNAIVNVQTSGQCSYDDLTIKIMQTKSSFPFGSSVVHDLLVDQDEVDLRYQDYFYGLFNLGSPNSALKWRIMEPVENEVNFKKVDEMLAAMEPHGVKMRGHTIAWGKEDKIADWVKEKDAGQLSVAVQRRIDYLAEHFSDRIGSWDVLNENIEGQWYEENTGNLEFAQGMFRRMNQLQPDAILFMNDYGLVTNGKYASAYRRKAGQYLANGIPLHALGIQSHVREDDIVNIGITQFRLDLVASAGLPIWITEFDLEDFDVTSRASKMVDLLHLYFSHPSMEGIILWGFWAKTNDMNIRGASLVDGDAFVENEAGAAVRNLFKNVWWTNLVQMVTSPQQVFRVFHGDHDIEVEMDGQTVWQGEMVVEKGSDTHVTINVNCD